MAYSSGLAPIKCSFCKGTGFRSNSTCLDCAGTGYVNAGRGSKVFGNQGAPMKCTFCKGTGFRSNSTCLDCAGTGYINGTGY